MSFRLHTADGVEFKSGLIVWVCDQRSKAYRAEVLTWRTIDEVVELRVMDAPPQLVRRGVRRGCRIGAWSGYLYVERPRQPIAASKYEAHGPMPHRRRRRHQVRA